MGVAILLGGGCRGGWLGSIRGGTASTSGDGTRRIAPSDGQPSRRFAGGCAARRPKLPNYPAALKLPAASPTLDRMGDVPRENMNDTAPSGPWYRDGLRFTCTQCGDCCTGAPGAVWVNDDEISAIANALRRSVADIRRLHTRRVDDRVSLTERANGDCTFLDPETRGCRVYQARPRQCRTWPFWNSNLQSRSTWREVTRTCPGAGVGTFFSLEEIEAQAARIDI